MKMLQWIIFYGYKLYTPGTQYTYYIKISLNNFVLQPILSLKQVKKEYTNILCLAHLLM